MVMSRVSKEKPTDGAESQGKTGRQEPRSSTNKVVAPGCKVRMGPLSDVKGSKIFGTKNDFKVTVGSKDITSSISCPMLLQRRAAEFAQVAARFTLGMEVTWKTIEENETPVPGFRKRSEIFDYYWNRPIYSKAVKFKGWRYICRKDYIKAGTGILEILPATPLQLSMNNSKEETRQGKF